MQYLNNYTLECSSNRNLTVYQTLSICSPLCKIIGLLTLIGMIFAFWFLYIAIVLWVISYIFSYFREKISFMYKYSLNDEKLIVYKDYNTKKQNLINCSISEISMCKICSNVSKDTTCYFDKGFQNGLIMEIVLNNKKYAIIADEYFYSVIAYFITKGAKI